MRISYSFLLGGVLRVYQPGYEVLLGSTRDFLNIRQAQTGLVAS